MVLGTTTTFINAQEAKLTYVGATSGDAGDELALVNDIAARVTREVVDEMVRAGPLFSPVWAIVDLEVQAALTKDLFDRIFGSGGISTITGLTKLTDASNLDYKYWKIDGASIDGTSANDISTEFEAAVVAGDILAADSGSTKVRFTLRVKGAAV